MRTLPLALLLAVHALPAQSPATADEREALHRFLAEAREGTARYRSQRAAIEEGFRRVGADFPAMGEHWVKPSRAMSGGFDAGEPAMLTYVRVGGVPTLAGVGYIAVLAPGEAPPDFAPARGFWHEHNGSVVEESLPSSHHGASPSGGEGLRVSVLHVWIWAENPEGPFVTNNWALPYLRLGIPPRAESGRGARHALSLALDGDEYYASTIRAALPASGAEVDSVERVIARYRSRALEVVEARPDPRDLDARSVARLEVLWAELWASLGDALPARRERLHALREHF